MRLIVQLIVISPSLPLFNCFSAEYSYSLLVGHLIVGKAFSIIFFRDPLLPFSILPYYLPFNFEAGA